MKAALVSSRTAKRGVIAVLSLYVVAIVFGLSIARSRALKKLCGCKLRLIWLGLQDHQKVHGVLPPAKIVDDAGNPILSWRAFACDYTVREESNPYGIDFKVAWDVPPNSLLHEGLASDFQCPSHQVKPADTDYVAVIGDDTMWPDDRQVSMDDADPSTILVVEWPNSGIHWMEPRDITVNEFLDWFGSGQRGHHGHCLLYIDVGGQVGELTADTDRQEILDLLSR